MKLVILALLLVLSVAPTAASVTLQIRGTLIDASGPTYVIRTERSLVTVKKEQLTAEQRGQLSRAGTRIALLLSPEQIESVRPLGESTPARKSKD